MRIYACHTEDKDKTRETSVAMLGKKELSAGYKGLDHYMSFAPKVKKTKQEILSFLIEQKQAGKSLVGYGAPAKGNTLLNYCGIRNDFIDFTVDRNPHKQGHFLPGTRIPIFHPDKILEPGRGGRNARCQKSPGVSLEHISGYRAVQSSRVGVYRGTRSDDR